MATTRIRIDGLVELQKRMSALAADMQQSVAHGAVLAGAQLIKREAISRAPTADEEHVIEGVHVKPGNLKKNIVVKRVPKGQSTHTSEYVVTVRGKARYGFASRYGSIQEFGSVKQAPRPFMRPAFDTKKGEAVAKIIEILTKRIAKAESGQ